MCMKESLRRESCWFVGICVLSLHASFHILTRHIFSLSLISFFIHNIFLISQVSTGLDGTGLMAAAFIVAADALNFSCYKMKIRAGKYAPVHFWSAVVIRSLWRYGIASGGKIYK